MTQHGNGTPAPSPGLHPSTDPGNTPAAKDYPATGAPNLEQTSHSRRQHQALADLPPGDPSEKPSPQCDTPEDEQLNSDDFLPCFDMRAASVSVAPPSETYDADIDDAPEGPAGEVPGSMPLTSAALAALPDACPFDFHGWIESLGQNGPDGAEGAGTWGHGETSRVDSGGLVAMGGWCVEETNGYPTVLRAEDVSSSVGMSGWVEVTRDQG